MKMLIKKAQSEYGDYLKSLRIAKGLTQERVGDLIGMGKQQWYNCEAGRAQMPVKYIKKAKLKLGASKEKLLELHLKIEEQKLAEKYNKA